MSGGWRPAARTPRAHTLGWGLCPPFSVKAALGVACYPLSSSSRPHCLGAWGGSGPIRGTGQFFTGVLATPASFPLSSQLL